MESKIFTDAEVKALDDRLNGSKLDKTGIYCRRVKPKILELLETWFPKKEKLAELVSKK